MKAFAAILSFFLPYVSVTFADDWPQWLGPKRDGVWRETGILDKFPEGGPKIIWRTKIGAGYAGPAVSQGKVFVADRHLATGAAKAQNPFQRGEIPGTESIVCLDEKTGKLVWKHQYDCAYTVSYAAGPRATPTVSGGIVYALGAEGHLFSLEADTGKVNWETKFGDYTGAKTPMWGWAGAPLVYGDLLICLAGGDGAVALALDQSTGEERWRALSAKEPGYCPPTLIQHGGKDQVIIWHPEAINSLNPVTGEVYWTIPWKLRSGLSIATPQIEGDILFFTSFYNGSAALRLKPDQSRPEVIWQTQHVSEKRTTHLHAIMPTPVLRDGLIFGTCSYGEFRCLDLATGDRIWESMEPSTKSDRKLRWFNQFTTPIGDRYILFNERGELIIAELSREGYRELDRAKVIEPDSSDMRQRSIVWTHPAYTNGCAVIRNDSEVIRVLLREE